MAYALRFDGVDDYVTIPNGMSGNIGTSTYSFRVKSGPNGITLPATLNRGFVGAALSSASGLVVTSGGLLEVWRIGNRLYGSAAQLISTGIPFDLTLSHLSDGSWTITNNLTSTVVDSGTYTNSITWSGSGELKQLGTSNANANGSKITGDLALIAVTGLANADTWDADLSGGSGSVWPSASGANDGTLVNFPADNSQWVFYSTGGTTYTLTATGATYSYSGGAATTAYSRVMQAAGGSFSYAGGSATLTYSPAGVVYTLNADGGVYSYSGGSATTAYNRVMTASGGAFAYSGGVATLSRNYSIAAAGGVYNYAGGDAALNYAPATGYRLTALGASFGYAGGEATFTYSQTYPQASARDFTVSGRLSESVSYSAIMYASTTYSGRLN